MVASVILTSNWEFRFNRLFHLHIRKVIISTVKSRLYVQVGTQKFGRRTERDVQEKIIFRITPCQVFWMRLYQWDVQTSGTYNWETYNWDSTVIYAFQNFIIPAHSFVSWTKTKAPSTPESTSAKQTREQKLVATKPRQKQHTSSPANIGLKQTNKNKFGIFLPVPH